LPKKKIADDRQNPHVMAGEHVGHYGWDENETKENEPIVASGQENRASTNGKKTRGRQPHQGWKLGAKISN